MGSKEFLCAGLLGLVTNTIRQTELSNSLLEENGNETFYYQLGDFGSDYV
jgi:hypothetical protein